MPVFIPYNGSTPTNGQALIGTGSTAGFRAITSGDVSGLGTLATLNAAPAGTLTGTAISATVLTASLNAITPSGGTLAVTGAATFSGDLRVGGASTGNIYFSTGDSSNYIKYNSDGQNRIIIRGGTGVHLDGDTRTYGSMFVGAAGGAGNFTATGSIKPGSINTATTAGTSAGQIVYDASGGANTGTFRGWNGSAWQKLDN